MKVISMEKAGAIYAIQRGHVKPIENTVDLDVSDVLGMPDGSSLDTFEQYLRLCEVRGIVILEAK